MTKKKPAATNGNSSPPSNTEMIKGQYGKYDSFYLSRFPPDKSNGTPFDITPHLEIVTQDENTCAHGDLCQCCMPLTTKHRCIICAFCLHPECGHELIETSVHKIPSTSISLVCKRKSPKIYTRRRTLLIPMRTKQVPETTISQNTTCGQRQFKLRCFKLE